MFIICKNMIAKYFKVVVKFIAFKSKKKQYHNTKHILETNVSNIEYTVKTTFNSTTETNKRINEYE